MSNMYSLLNYIAATSKEIYESSNSSQILNNPLYASNDHTTLQSAETGLRGLSEDDKRLVGISTISVVTRLALEFRMEEVVVSNYIVACVDTIATGYSTDNINVTSATEIRRAHSRGCDCL